MWSYEKRLQFPVNIKEPNAKLAQAIMSQYGGPDGEGNASMRYLSQRYAMPYNEVSAVLTDIGTEELAHLEMVATIVHQLTRDLSMEEIDKVPERQLGNGIKVDVYTKYGDFIETLNTVKEVREKYNVPSSKIKNIEQGNRYFKDWIFKYHTSK